MFSVRVSLHCMSPLVPVYMVYVYLALLVTACPCIHGVRVSALYVTACLCIHGVHVSLHCMSPLVPVYMVYVYLALLVTACLCTNVYTWCMCISHCLSPLVSVQMCIHGVRVSRTACHRLNLYKCVYMVYVYLCTAPIMSQQPPLALCSHEQSGFWRFVLVF